HRKKSENWHWRRPFRTARSLRTLIKPGQRSWSSWIKDQAAWHECIILRQAMSDQNKPPGASENRNLETKDTLRGFEQMPRQTKPGFFLFSREVYLVAGFFAFGCGGPQAWHARETAARCPSHTDQDTA